jgi:hypothetical protein
VVTTYYLVATGYYLVATTYFSRWKWSFHLEQK